ncbi:MAG: hypothetical protein KAR21_08520 [Spirochaetales bacterium]|nr:hypothetical protein [Spirochaetales bacterium]
MKMTPAMKKAQENMQAGVIIADGFLGDEKKSIKDMMVRDEAEMIRAGLSFDEVSERLVYFLEEGRKGLGEPVTVNDKWLIRVIDPRGHLPCPFEDGIFRKISAEIELKSSGEKLLVTDLSIHLLKDHHFIEGIGSQFRLEPELVKRVLFGT